MVPRINLDQNTIPLTLISPNLAYLWYLVLYSNEVEGVSLPWFSLLRLPTHHEEDQQMTSHHEVTGILIG